jgi:hypothetical protein
MRKLLTETKVRQSIIWFITIKGLNSKNYKGKMKQKNLNFNQIKWKNCHQK